MRDFRNAGLPPEEVAIMAHAQRVILEPGKITQEDVDKLRSFGFSDEDVADITLVAGARSFFSKSIDALGVSPDLIDVPEDADYRAALGISE